MASNGKFDKSKLPSRHVSVGPQSAPHRAFYYAMGMTEAEIAHRALLASGVPATTPFEFEQESRDTLQNLRHARQLIGAEARPVVLVSNRYHLPRCALFARHLGIDHVLCAAEAQWRPSPSNLAKLALESAYCMWVDVGRRWAQLIGHRRMLGKVS